MVVACSLPFLTTASVTRKSSKAGTLVPSASAATRVTTPDPSQLMANCFSIGVWCDGSFASSGPCSGYVVNGGGGEGTERVMVSDGKGDGDLRAVSADGRE